jgi:vacuolar-type H+-ATPase subunit D/Vma8
MIDKGKIFTRRSLKAVRRRASRLNHENDVLVLQLLDHIDEMNKAFDDIDKELKEISKRERAISVLVDQAYWSGYDQKDSAQAKPN